MEQLSITITGPEPGTLEHDRIMKKAWGLTGLSQIEFANRVMPRMPVSLDPMEAETAKRRFQALVDAGVQCALDEDDGRRYIIKHGDRTCGPVVTDWLKRALDSRLINPVAQIRSVGVDQHDAPVIDWAVANGFQATFSKKPRVGTDLRQRMEISGYSLKQDVDRTFIVPTVDHVDRSSPYAGFWRRALAFFIDLYVMQAIVLVLEIIFFASFGFLLRWNSFNSVIYAFAALSTLIGIGYFTFQEASTRMATIGKLAVGLKVVDGSNNQISRWRAICRYGGTILSTFTLGIGFLPCLWTKRRQALQDKISHSFVIRAPALEGLQTSTSSERTNKGLPTWGWVVLAFACMFSGASTASKVWTAITPASPAYIPQPVLDLIRFDSSFRPAIKAYFGYTPAPQPALAYLASHPWSINQFERAFGYIPKGFQRSPR